MDPLIRALSAAVDSPVELDDPSGDVYYTVREEGSGVRHVHLLNTDWSAAGNRKQCRLRLGGHWIEVEVAEGRLSEIIWCGNLALLVEDEKIHIDGVSVREDGFEIDVHGYRQATLKITLLDATEVGAITFADIQVTPVAGDSWVIVDLVFSKQSVGKLRGTS